MVSETTGHRSVWQPGMIISENRPVAIVCPVYWVLYCTVLCSVACEGLRLAGPGRPGLTSQLD